MNEEDATDPDTTDTADVSENRSESETSGGDHPDGAQHPEEHSEAAVSQTDEPNAETLEWVSESDAAELAREFETLQNEIETLTAERDTLEADVDTLEERVQRVQADFQNYKKRTERRREEEQALATQDLVERLLPVRDNLTRALEQDEDSDIRDGGAATLTAFDDVLQAEGVEVLEPSQGDPVEPTRHEVVHREDEQGEVVSSVYRRGYEMGGQILRPAQVTVGSATEETEADAATDDARSEHQADQ